MLELYIGGYAQGKLRYVLNRRGNGNVVREAKQIFCYTGEERIIFDRFQDWFRDRLMQQAEPEREMECIIKEYQTIIIIGNEIGCGIVPAEAFERDYRERYGRYLCELAKTAERVERIVCGIGQRIK